MRIVDEETIEIEGGNYLTLSQFARLTSRTEGMIRSFIINGGEYRKLQVKRFFRKPFIPVEELFKYPFSKQGVPSKNKKPYFYKLEKGLLVIAGESIEE